MVSRKPSILAFSALALVAATSACGGSDEAPDTAEMTADAGVDVGVIEERQENFETIGDAFKVIRDELDADAPDYAAIASASQTIDTGAQKVSGLFPEGTGIDSGADTEALATIWEQPEQFAEAHMMLTSASAALLEASASEDPAVIGAAVGDLGGSCKNCHDTFRLDDE